MENVLYDSLHGRVITISLKKYMFIDLGILTLLGVIIEMAGVFASDRLLGGTMTTFCFSVLIMIIAQARWGYKGLMISPILALATYIAGRFLIPHADFRGLYDYVIFISIFAGLLSTSISLLWFKVIGQSKTLKSLGLTMLFCLSVILVVLGIQTLIYLIFNNGISISIYLIIYNSLGILFTIVGILLLRQQDTLNNVKRKILKDKKQREAELEYERKFFDDLSAESIVDSTPKEN